MNKNKDKILIGIGMLIVFLYFLCMLLAKETTNLDELWNYNIARNIVKGLIPYKDISLITTPLLPMLEAVILWISLNELIIFRVLNASLITAIIFVTYKIFTKFKVKKTTSAILVLPLIWILKDEIFLDYNFFVLILSLIILMIELKQVCKGTSKKLELLIGLLGGLSICTKQTIGVIICANIILLPLIVRWSKNEIKNIIYRFIGITIPVVILIVYLLAKGAFYDFLSYTILAINTFSNSIPYSSLLGSNELEIRILAIFMPIIIIVLGVIGLLYKRKYGQKEDYKLIEVAFLCGLPLLMIQYPIDDRLHFLLSNYIMMILCLFIIYYLVKRLYNVIKLKTKKFASLTMKVFALLCGAVFLIIGLINNANAYIKSNKNNELKYYNNLIVPEYIQSLYNKIQEKEKHYEQQGKKVIILDSNAVALHIPMDKYVKNYDMFNKGNFGKDGEEGLIKQIKEKDNQVYLVKKQQFQKNWQNPKLVTEYVENNLTKIDEVDIYDIYEK